MEHSDFPRRRQLLREIEFPGSSALAHPPDLFVDFVQLLLNPHGQSLGIGLPAGRQQSGRAEEGNPVALAVRHALLTLQHLGHVGQHAGLLPTLLVLIFQGLHLGTRGPRLVSNIPDSSSLSGTEHSFTWKP